MKKFVAVLFTLLLVFCFITAYAIPSAPNYLLGLSWKEGHESALKKVDGLYVEATNLTKSYSTPALDITDAVKQVFYDHAMSKYISVKISGKMKLSFVGGKRESDSIRVIMRGKTSIKDVKVWKEQYTNSLKGDEPFFSLSNNNAIGTVTKNITVSTHWVSFSATVDLTKNNVFSDSNPTWNLCVDGLDPNKNPETLFLKDFSMEVVLVSNSKPTQTATATATPSVTPTPTADIPPRVTPSRTLAPYSTPVGEGIPQPSATLKPTSDPITDEQIRNEFKDQPLLKDIKNILSLSVKGAVIIIIIAGFFAIITNLFKRKK